MEIRNKMSFKCGLVGMPNVGKSSIFNLLTEQKIPANNYPFCTIDPNIAYVQVPDKRLNALGETNKSENIVNASIEFVDIAGLIKGASKGEGLGNEFLGHINSTDVIAHVVRFFKDKEVIHVKDNYTPLEDFEDINLELADIGTLEKYLERFKKSKTDPKEKEILSTEMAALLNHLSEDNFASSFIFSEELAALNDLKLLTKKPMFVIGNINEQSDQKEIDEFRKQISSDIQFVTIDVGMEQDITELDENDQEEFLKDLGLTESALSRIISAGYKLLGLKTFFTSGPKETRAWAAKKGFNARECSGIIHTDIKKGFIRAETVAYSDYIKYDGDQGSKTAGVWRQEGKDYMVEEGDVIYFRFNV
jgi:hypothetical protein